MITIDKVKVSVTPGAAGFESKVDQGMLLNRRQVLFVLCVNL